jgi:N-acyl-D-amino-acid deacylase
VSHDLVLRGGSVLDGTGSPARTADVAIAGGRIVAVGRVDGTTARSIDVAGAVVCPGFIDLHSHADFSVLGSPEAVTQVTQGVTTLVTGNCGFSPFPVVPEHADELRTHGSFIGAGLSWDWSTAGEFAARVEALPLGVNLALQVGHGAIRIGGMGLDDRAPTPAELDRMRVLVRQAVADGCVGFTSGLIYAPGMFATTDELVALAKEAAAGGLIYSTHMRDEGEELLEAIEEALTIARTAGIRLEISHLKSSGVANRGKVSPALDLITNARGSGIDVQADQYPYTASSTTLTSFLPGWAMDGGTPALLQRLGTPSAVDRLASELNARSGVSFWPERIVIARTPDGPYAGYVGQNVAAVSAELGLDVGHGVAELLAKQQGRISIIHHGMSEDDVRLVMSSPYVSVASDGGVLGCPGEGRPHPRSLGTFVRVLGRYVREFGVLSWPEAVRKMTSLPAARLGWTDRGVLRQGAVADVAVFDPSTVVDNATFADPWQLASGVRYTLLAGTPVLDDGVPTGIGAGRVVRRPS